MKGTEKNMAMDENEIGNWKLKIEKRKKRAHLFPVPDHPVLSAGYISVARYHRFGFEEMLALHRMEHPFLR